VHKYEQCVCLKVPGTQLYAADSPLFKRRIDVLNQVFDNLPAPQGLPTANARAAGEKSDNDLGL
jgi:hypothetical protein